MGGSFALKLKEHTIGGWDENEENLSQAKSLGIIDLDFETLEEGLQWSDVILLTIPVSAIKRELPEILNVVNNRQTVIDFGSTKSSICEAVRNHSNRQRFVAAHPIAGTEYSGPEAAFSSLYEKKVMIYCESDYSATDALEVFKGLCQIHNMVMVPMSPEDHDQHLAYISHLSHIIAYSLSNVVLEKERDGQLILELAGSGFASTVRLAKSSPEMWTPIFLDNKTSLLNSMADIMTKLKEMERFLSQDDAQAIYSFLEEGRKIRKILD